MPWEPWQFYFLYWRLADSQTMYIESHCCWKDRHLICPAWERPWMRPPLFTPQTEAWWSPVSVVIFANHHLLPLLPKKGVLWVIRRPGRKPRLIGWFLAIEGQIGVVEVSLSFEGKTPSLHRLPESQPLGYVPVIYSWSIFICTHSQSQQICWLSVTKQAEDTAVTKQQNGPFWSLCVWDPSMECLRKAYHAISIHGAHPESLPCDSHLWNAYWKPTMCQWNL